MNNTLFIHTNPLIDPQEEHFTATLNYLLTFKRATPKYWRLDRGEFALYAGRSDIFNALRHYTFKVQLPHNQLLSSTKDYTLEYLPIKEWFDDLEICSVVVEYVKGSIRHIWGSTQHRPSDITVFYPLWWYEDLTK